jgi:UDP-glucose 4-epimerase
MRVLVTGGTGYIGSTAVEILLTQGFEISILDDCSMGHADTVPAGVRFVNGSLLNVSEVADALTGCDAVMHFAGKSLVGESVEKPDLYHSVNVDGTRILLDEMRKQSITKIVFSSSAATYGEPKSVPILETSETNPTNPYGATKLAIDHMITAEAAEAAAYGISAASLRYFNVAGALKAKRGWLAERHNPETHLIPNVLRSTTDNPVKIFGTDWPTEDGTCIRDYVHVIDLIDAHLKALNSLGKPGHEIYNLGSGSGYSVREVVAAASAATGHQIPFIDSPRRAGDPAVLIADISKAKTHLGWEPTRDMNTMVSDTLKSMA